MPPPGPPIMPPGPWLAGELGIILLKSEGRSGGQSRAAMDAIAAAGEEAAMAALQAEGRAVLQAYVEEVAQLRTERGALRGELQAAAVSSRLAAAAMNEE